MYRIYLIKHPSCLNAQGKSSVFVNKRPYMGRGTVGGAEIAHGTQLQSSKYGMYVCHASGMRNWVWLHLVLSLLPPN